MTKLRWVRAGPFRRKKVHVRVRVRVAEFSSNYVRAECAGYVVDYSNYASSVALIASSNTDTAAQALVGAGSVWVASVDDVDDDGDFVYSVLLTSNSDDSSYLASLRMDVANVEVLMLYVQCRERPGRWSVATAPVCGRALCQRCYSYILLHGPDPRRMQG